MAEPSEPSEQEHPSRPDVGAPRVRAAVTCCAVLPRWAPFSGWTWLHS